MFKRLLSRTLIVAVLVNLLSGCLGHRDQVILENFEDASSQEKPLILLPIITEVYQVPISEVKNKDVEWTGILKQNIQESIKDNLESSGIAYIKVDAEALTEEEALRLAEAYLEFEKTEKILIQKYWENVPKSKSTIKRSAIKKSSSAMSPIKSSVKSYIKKGAIKKPAKKPENTLKDSDYIEYMNMPSGMSLYQERGNKALYCKAIDEYSTTERTIKRVVIIGGLIVILVAVMVLAGHGNIPGGGEGAPLGKSFVSCTLADLKSNSILWYKAKEIKKDSKDYEYIHRVIANILKDLPLLPNDQLTQNITIH